MTNIQKIMDLNAEFLEELTKTYGYDEVLTAVVLGIASRVANNSESLDEAIEMGQLISTALVGSIEAAYKDGILESPKSPEEGWSDF